MWTQSQIGTMPSSGLGTTFNIRDGAHLIQTDSGRILIVGGWNPYAPEDEPVYGAAAQIVDWDGYTTNEVWASDDDGETFTELLAHDNTTPTSGAGARFHGFHTGGVIRHAGYVVVVGGDAFDIRSDLWRSTDGETWERMSASAPWQGLMLQMTASFNGAIYVMGGQTNLGDAATANANVWKTTDYGVNWTQIDDAPWAPRGMVYSPVVHNGALYVVGGGTYDDTARDYYNGVYRFNTDETWDTVVADGHGQFLGRQYHNVVSTGGRLWAFNGYNEVNLLSGVYSDNNGVTWSDYEDPLWGASHADSMCVTSDHRILAALGNNGFNTLDRGVYQISGT